MRLAAALLISLCAAPLVRAQTPIDAQMMQGFLNEMRKRSAPSKPGPG